MGEGFMSIVQRILFSGKVALFVCVSGLAGAFFGVYPAVAHPSPGSTPSVAHDDDLPRAQDVDRMNEDSMREFMEHLKIHLVDGTVQAGERTYIPLDWRVGDDFYSIYFGVPGQRIIQHQKYPQAQSASLPRLEPMLLAAQESGGIECEQEMEAIITVPYY